MKSVWKKYESIILIIGGLATIGVLGWLMQKFSIIPEIGGLIIAIGIGLFWVFILGVGLYWLITKLHNHLHKRRGDDQP